MPRATREPTIPSDRDAVLADKVNRALDECGAGESALTVRIVAAGKERTALDLPPAAAILLKAVPKEMAAGRAVTVVPIDTEITTGHAAELLHVSRAFVVGLIDKGMSPARMVGAHRRVLPRDVLTYKTDSKTKARAALDEMVAISQDPGLE